MSTLDYFFSIVKVDGGVALTFSVRVAGYYFHGAVFCAIN